MPAYSSSAMSKPASWSAIGSVGSCASAPSRGIARALADDQAAQRRAVVVALEPALAHLAVGHEGEHLVRGARGIRQRDVGEQVDVDDLAGEDLDGRVVAGDQRERIPRSRARDRGEGLGSSPAFHRVGRSLTTRKTALGRSVVWEREHTA